MQNVTSFTFKGKQHFLLDIFSVINLRQTGTRLAVCPQPVWMQAFGLHRLLEPIAVTARELLAEPIGEFRETKFSIARSTEAF